MTVLENEQPALGMTAHIDFSGHLDLGVPPALIQDGVAVVREALSNVARHANGSNAKVVVDLTDGEPTLEVIDDGVGIKNTGRSSGMANMRRRAEVNGGTLDLSSPRRRNTPAPDRQGRQPETSAIKPAENARSREDVRPAEHRVRAPNVADGHRRRRQRPRDAAQRGTGPEHPAHRQRSARPRLPCRERQRNDPAEFSTLIELNTILSRYTARFSDPGDTVIS